MIEMTETQIKKESVERSLNKMLGNVKRNIALDDLESACRDYLDARSALEEAALDEAREDLKIALEEYEGTGATIEQIDGVLDKYGLSRNKISSWE
jgi:hypothetical protein